MSDINFVYPEIAWLIPVIIITVIMREKFRNRASIVFSDVTTLTAAAPSKICLKQWLPILLRIIVFLLLILALARPQITEHQKEQTTEGIDIILAIDTSGSMKAEDFQPLNRLEVAKEEARKFIKWREHDRIGLVIFAKESITQCPLTLDHNVLLSFLDKIQVGYIDDGTAIGLSLSSAVNRLRDSKAKSKVIILLTDGENNAGQIDPETAAELANTFDVKVYTIGIGREGLVPFPHDDPLLGRRYLNVEVNIDIETLQKIAQITGGKFFRARDKTSLEQAYSQINELEKTEIKSSSYEFHSEVFHLFAYPAMLFLILEIFIRNFFSIKIP